MTTANISHSNLKQNEIRKMPENKKSKLLTMEENYQVFRLLGSRCLALATAVVQVFKAEPPAYNCWVKRAAGVACFVKDNSRRSYFIRVVDLNKNGCVFDQEMYLQFRYKTPRPHFHTFESDICQVGLNFADQSEASLFQQVVIAKQEDRRIRRERRSSARQNAAAAPPPPPSVNGGVMGSRRDYEGQNDSRTIGINSVTRLSLNETPKLNKGGSHKRLRKEDIGLPTNFKHISHVGWDPKSGFDLENVDPKLNEFFSMAGISERQLADKETRDFIYRFIDDNGGIEAAISDLDKRTKGSVPPCPPPRQSSITKPPPPPSRQLAGHENTPSPPMGVKFPAPSLGVKSPAPAPPPPPPPPPPPAPSNDRSQLMADIRSGASSLKRVADIQAGKSDARDELLHGIRSGVVLRKVEVSTSPACKDGEAGISNGMAGMLKKALAERCNAIQLSSSESENEVDVDEDDWD